MGRVSLILPIVNVSALPAGEVERWRHVLENAGHSVEVVAVLEADDILPEDTHLGADRWLNSPGPGLASAAIAGLSSADGDLLVVLDPARRYRPVDLLSTVELIASGKADLVTARRDSSSQTRAPAWLLRAAIVLSRRFLGTSDPLSGLVAITPALYDEIAGTFVPVGSRFALDLLLRSKGRKSEVTVETAPRAASPTFGLDDLRHLKRLADDRFGNVSRLLQFCAVGASGMVVDLSFYALFQHIFSRTWLATRPAPFLGSTLDLAVSGAIGIALALTWNFSLNRRLTFSYARYGRVFRQFLVYAMSNALGIALSFTLRLYLPSRFGFFHDHKLAAAVVGIVTATGISFSLARWVVFNKHTTRQEGNPSSEVVGSSANSYSL